MTDWFVYQRDLYVNDLDPNSLGLSLQPLYDVNQNIIYRDSGNNTNGLRRVKSYWGIDPLIVQFDAVIQTQLTQSRVGLPPLHTHSQMTQTIQWLPSQHQFQFRNTTHGFHFENVNTQQCVEVSRSVQDQQTTAKLMQKDVSNQYTVFVGDILFIRVHRLAQLTPTDLDTTIFSKYVSAHLNVKVNSNR